MPDQVSTRNFLLYSVTKGYMVTICTSWMFSVFIRQGSQAKEKNRFESKALVTSADWRSLDLLQQNSQRYLHHWSQIQDSSREKVKHLNSRRTLHLFENCFNLSLGSPDFQVRNTKTTINYSLKKFMQQYVLLELQNKVRLFRFFLMNSSPKLSTTSCPNLKQLTSRWNLSRVSFFCIWSWIQALAQ